MIRISVRCYLLLLHSVNRSNTTSPVYLFCDNMDAIQEAMNQLSATFTERMGALETELLKGVPSTTTTASLSSEFFNFKTFILKSLRVLQEQIDLIQLSVDQIEMRSRKKILLLHGVPEQKDESTTNLVASIVAEKLKLKGFNVSEIQRSHRMGKVGTSGGRPRPILFKVCDMVVRSKIWMAKTNLKGTGLTLSEFLTRRRHHLFTEARKRFGVKGCWTRDGAIYVLDSDGTRHRIEKEIELINFSAPATNIKDSQPVIKESAVTTKTRRQAVGGKK